jgi:ubiquinone/menaquinone biosynthesis C-methylase UbiE
MLEKILPFMRCPRCSQTDLRAASMGLSCRFCDARYPAYHGILDLANAEPHQVITPFQRVMQTPLVVSIYESFWRRLGYFIASSRKFEKEIQTVLGYLPGRESGRVLDLACGTGVFTRLLARRVQGFVVGLDLSWPMLLHARRLIARDGIDNVLLMRGTAVHLPFVAGAFPFINCCGALHLFDNPDLVLKEIERVLPRGGHLSVQTTIRPEHSAGVAYLLERFIRFGFFDESELRERMRLHSFKMLESERHRISYTFLARRS